MKKQTHFDKRSQILTQHTCKDSLGRGVGAAAGEDHNSLMAQFHSNPADNLRQLLQRQKQQPRQVCFQGQCKALITSGILLEDLLPERIQQMEFHSWF